MRHYEHAYLLSNIEKLPLPILGSMFPFWNPTGVFLQWAAHVEKDRPSLFVAFPFNPRPSSSAPPEGEGAPGSSGPVHLGHIRPCGTGTEDSFAEDLAATRMIHQHRSIVRWRPARQFSFYFPLPVFWALGVSKTLPFPFKPANRRGLLIVGISKGPISILNPANPHGD